MKSTRERRRKGCFYALITPTRLGPGERQGTGWGDLCLLGSLCHVPGLCWSSQCKGPDV